jgi:hypothetical protein
VRDTCNAPPRYELMLSGLQILLFEWNADLSLCSVDFNMSGSCAADCHLQFCGSCSHCFVLGCGCAASFG